MSKKNNQQVEATKELPSLSDIGAVRSGAKTVEAGGMERYPIYSVKDLEVGKPFAGNYLRTRSWTNDNGDDVTVHEFRGQSGQKFGLWGTGVTVNFFGRCPANAYVVVTYKGKAEKAYKPGQSPAHEFKFELEEGVELLPEPVMAPAAQAQGNAARPN